MLAFWSNVPGGPYAAHSNSDHAPLGMETLQSCDSNDERFLIAFLQAHSQGASTQDWSCDEIARTEEEARAYALQFGVSQSSFTNALEHLRATCAAGNAD